MSLSLTNWVLFWVVSIQSWISSANISSGVDNPYAPLTNQDICLQFGIVDADGNQEYQEEVQVTTDTFGMVNLLIGTNTQTGGYAADL